MTSAEVRKHAERMLAGANGNVQVVVPAGHHSQITAKGKIVIDPQHDAWSVPAVIRCKSFKARVDLMECKVHDDGVRTVVTLPRASIMHPQGTGRIE